MTILFPTWTHLIAYLATTGKRGSVSRKQGRWVFKESGAVNIEIIAI